MMDTMKQVEAGRLDVRAEVRGDYEISALSRYFNQMLDNIDALIQEEYLIEKKKKEAEMQVLMGQINPHFLYNTLESIVWKARSGGLTEVADMAAALGRLFRIAVNRGRLFVTVGEEMEHLRAYLRIQSARYGERIRFETEDVSETVRQGYMLKLVIQPLVENAITHGAPFGLTADLREEGGFRMEVRLPWTEKG